MKRRTAIWAASVFALGVVLGECGLLTEIIVAITKYRPKITLLCLLFCVACASTGGDCVVETIPCAEGPVIVEELNE